MRAAAPLPARRLDHFLVERAHDTGDLHLVVAVGSHPASRPGQPGYRWMSRSGEVARLRGVTDGDGVDLDEEFGAQAGDDVDRDGRRWVGRVPRLLEGGDTLVERVAVHHGDGPVHDVRKAGALALEDGREVAERLAGLLPDGGADDLAVGVDAVLPADVDRLGRLFDHDGLAEGRVAVEPLGVDVPDAHVSPPLTMTPVTVVSYDTSYHGGNQMG